MNFFKKSHEICAHFLPEPWHKCAREDTFDTATAFFGSQCHVRHARLSQLRDRLSAGLLLSQSWQCLQFVSVRAFSGSGESDFNPRNPGSPSVPQQSVCHPDPGSQNLQVPIGLGESSWIPDSLPRHPPFAATSTPEFTPFRVRNFSLNPN